ncbi:transcription factor bHLH118-like [Senna tora]|uniref:Transcription factor bHLH118-like n=1 Tax=Senna tora TaxID=362788 RepID=A0A834TGY1_9FABA|nr:transcription factor bHLH118-like [Senna tora]
MFPLQRGSELLIQFSNTTQHHQQTKISQDPILNDFASSPRVDDYHKNIHLAPRNYKNKLFHHHHRHESSDDHTKKKKKMMMIHREIERQRRQEMASLYASLRSLLPLHYIKGKRSVSDHMNEAVNYIKQLQKNIKELGAKRDELKKKQYHLESNNHHHESHQNPTTKFITVHHHNNNGSLGIEITSGFQEERTIKLSKLLELLIQERGLEVVNCVSTKVNGRVLHSVHCEVKNSDSVDLAELRRKIANACMCDSVI